MGFDAMLVGARCEPIAATPELTLRLVLIVCGDSHADVGMLTIVLRLSMQRFCSGQRRLWSSAQVVLPQLDFALSGGTRR